MEDHQVYASESTLNQLGFIAQRLPEIAEADLILVSRDDIISYKDGQKPSLYDVDNQTQAFYDAIDVDKTVQNITDMFNKVAPDAETAELWLEVAFNTPEFFDLVINQEAAAGGVDFDQDGKNDFGLVSLPYMDQTNQELLATIAHRPLHAFDDVPEGTGKDVLAAVLYHEAAHVNDERDVVTVLRETHADHEMSEYYQHDVDMGKLSAGIIEHMENARLIGSLGNGGLLGMGNVDLSGYEGSHSTHAVYKDSSLASESLDDIDNAEFRGTLALNDISTSINGMMVWQEWVKDGPDAFENNSTAQYYFESYDEMVLEGSDFTDLYKIGSDQVDHEYAAYATVKAIEAEGILDSKIFEGERDYIENLDRYFERYEQGVHDDEGYKNTYNEVREFLKSSGLTEQIQASIKAQDVADLQPNIGVSPTNAELKM